MLQARQGLDVRKVKFAERLPRGAHRHQARPDASPASWISGVHDAVEHHRVEVPALVRPEELIQGADGYLRYGRRVQRLDLRLRPHGFSDRVAGLDVSISLDRR